MSCCGQRRRALVAHTAPASIPAASIVSRPGPLAAPAPLRAGVWLRYRGLGPFTARGAHTGRVYLCASGAPVQVESADVEALLLTKRFTRA
jgi:hypothetical protein